MAYCDVILPVPVEGTFTYILPETFSQGCQVGCRVSVPFGNKQYTGIVCRLYSEPPQVAYQLKAVLDVVDPDPIVTDAQLDLWQWMSFYYLCSLGDVYKAAVPAGLRPSSETLLVPNEDFCDWSLLTERECKAYELLHSGKANTVAQLLRLTKDSALMRAVKGLVQKGAVTVKESMESGFKPKTEVHVRLTERYRTAQGLDALLQTMGHTPKRKQLVMAYVELSGISSAIKLKNSHLIQEVSKVTLLQQSGISMPVLAALRGKGVFEFYNYEIGRLRSKEKTAVSQQLPLSDAQQQAFTSICQQLKEKQVCLFHGVTSSGKTEVYIRLIRQVVEQGGQVLYLLPEIALTTQITERLRRIFGNQMGVYHSKFPDNERVEIWQKQLSRTPYKLMLGVRSSIFLPFENLQLVIVDEEHETSYKQEEPSPRYQARDTAIVMAKQMGAKVLLGTATPSIESFWNAQTGKYGYTELTTRYGNIQLPYVEVADVKELLRTKQMKLPFSPRLEEEMAKALDGGRQVILFQNRRGYAPVMECNQCGWTPTCECCDVTLTYHQDVHRMVCHYCGRSFPVPAVCPNCGDTHLRSFGFGTEKIEEEVHKRFPSARTARLDLDTTRNRNSYETIILDFSQGKTDVLIGTQMVSKGLDFDRVHVVGILDADTMLTRPDFRSFERSFQMMSQVAGRAGRRNSRGYVILQTRHADNHVVHQVVNNDYKSMYNSQLEEREAFRYPPFYRLVYVYLKHKQDVVVEHAAQEMVRNLVAMLGDRVLGPDKPVVSRVQLMYIRKIAVKAERTLRADKLREMLTDSVRKLHQVSGYSSVLVYFDVDPM